MSSNKLSVEEEARTGATHTLSDGKPIMDRALLTRCADEIDQLKAALRDIAANGQSRGGIWARKRAEEAMEPKR